MISAVYQWFSHPISDHYQELFAYVPTIRFIGLYPSTKRTALQYASLTGGRLPGPLIIRGPTEIRSCHQLVTCGGGGHPHFVSFGQPKKAKGRGRPPLTFVDNFRSDTGVKNTGEIKELWRTETFGDTPSRLGLWSRLKSSKSSEVYYYFGFIVSARNSRVYRHIFVW